MTSIGTSLARRRRLPSPAMIVALIALFVALSGSATAALMITGANIKNGTVTGYDLKNGSVTGYDLKTDAVTGAKVKNGTLMASDFEAGQLPAGVSGLEVVTGSPTTLFAGQSGYAQAYCPGGKRAISGGGGASEDDVRISNVGVWGQAHAGVRATNLKAIGSVELYAWVLCAKIG
jgi:hypothetical protein